MSDRDAKIQPSDSPHLPSSKEQSTAAFEANYSGDLPTEMEERHQAEDPLLAQVLDQYLDDLQNGRACSRDTLIAQHPKLAADLNECLDGIEMVAGLGVGADLAPKRMGDFEVMRAIGRGAMGVVYQARQVSLKRMVALKMLRYSAAGFQASKRFEREAELVATLHHENIVPVYAYGQHENLHYFAMQLIDGPSLAGWSVTDEAKANRDEIEIAKWGAQVARALAHAHQRDVIHRDVKPSNLLKDGDKIWLTDFGLARRFDDVRMSMTGAMLGTPNYMSPEQAAPARHPIDHRTDVYSLGATLFELLTGRCVFLADTPHAVLAQLLTEEATPLRELLPDSSRDLETILIKCLQKEPRDRYETAAALAEDLESFAAGRSIKARRPSMIERAVRWRRQNEKAFSWATTAAIAVVMLATVSGLAWNGWRNANRGKLMLTSDEGPIVARLIDERGDTTPTFTIPTQNPMQVDSGNYELEVWASGKIGEARALAIDPGGSTNAKIRLPELGVFPEQTIQGLPTRIAVPTDIGQRHDFVLLGGESIARMDGRTGKVLWSTDVEAFTLESKTPPRQSSDLEYLESPAEKSFRWDWMTRTNLTSIDQAPTVLEHFGDINGDSVIDVFVSCQRQLASFVLDGLNGNVLWRYVPSQPREHPGREQFNGQYRVPQLVNDLDGDQIDDLICLSYSENHFGDKRHWVDAVSGKTGKRLWHHDLDSKWFDLPNERLAPANMLTHSGFLRLNRDLIGNNSDFLYRCRPPESSGQFTGIAPWPMVVTNAASEAAKKFGWIVVGTHLLKVNLSDGSLANEAGTPFDLGFYPSMAPRVLSIAGQNDQLLFAEQAAFGTENQMTDGQVRYTLWSTETKAVVWNYIALADSTWMLRGSDWPKIADVTGDSIPEIIIADGADLGTAMYRGASCEGSLQALNAKSGKPIWKADEIARIRSQDRQVSRFVIGPDADGDSLDDIYVVSPVLKKAKVRILSVFIDVVSTKSGKLIRSTETPLPFVQATGAVNLQRPTIWGEAPDGSPQIVVATQDSGLAESTAVISTGTGKLIYSAADLFLAANVDGDGDGGSDLFMFRTRDRDRPFQSNQFVSLKSSARERHKIIGTDYRVVHDLDGDGTRDLLTANYPRVFQTQRAISGRTGNTIWHYKFPELPGRFQSLGADIDGDGCHDFFGQERINFGSYAEQISLVVSGRTGKELWRLDVRGDRSMGDFTGTFTVRCADVDADGRLEIMLIHRMTIGPGGASAVLAPGAVGRWRTTTMLTCVDAKKGLVKWHADLTPEGSPGQSFCTDLTNWPIHILKRKRAIGAAIICPGFRLNRAQQFVPALCAIVGNDGEELWNANYTADEQRNQFNLWRFHVSDNESKDGVGVGNQLVRCERNVVDQTIKVKWNDRETGREMSSWTGPGTLINCPDQFDSNRDFEFGAPFDVRDGTKIYTGVCVRGRRDDQNIQLLILDSSEPKAKLVTTIDVIRDRTREFVGQFQLADVNQDGRVDVVFHDGQKLIAKDLISADELLECKLPTKWRSLLGVDDQSRLHLLSDAVDGVRLKLIDISTFQTQWSVPVPPRVSLNEAAEHFGVKMIQSDDQLVPEFYFAGDEQVSTVASLRDFVGSDANVISSFKSNDQAFKGIQGMDPRRSIPLPWSPGDLSNWNDDGLAWNIFSRLIVILGAVVFPIIYLRYWTRNRSVSLRMFLLLPLLFVVPYVAMTQPLDPRISLTYLRGAWLEGRPWLNTLARSAFLIPSLVVLWFGIARLLQGRWRSFLTVVLVTVAISIVSGVFLLTVKFQELPSGSHYEFWDLGSLALIPYGLFWTGVLLMFGWGMIRLRRLGARIFRRQKNSLGTLGTEVG